MTITKKSNGLIDSLSTNLEQSTVPNQSIVVSPPHPRSLGLKATDWFMHRLSGKEKKPSAVSKIVGNYNPRATRFMEPERVKWGEHVLLARSRTKLAKLNVGGQRHEVRWKTLRAIPDSRLGRLSLSYDPLELGDLMDDYDSEIDECYFDRSANMFVCVLNAYRLGRMHFLDNVCVLSLEKELNYWGLKENVFELCCLQRYYKQKEQMEEEIRKTNEILLPTVSAEKFGVDRLGQWQKKIWNLVENPQTSMAARIFGIVSVTFIILSVIGLNLSTIRQNHMNETQTQDKAITTHSEELIDPRLETLELVCTIWFTLEFVVRFCASPDKCVFIKGFINLIDLIAILPYYITEILEFYLNSTLNSLVTVRKVVQMFRILRILRVFKLARHSQGLQALGLTMSKSYKELGLLMMFVVLVVLLFSSLAYFAEKDDNPVMFSSIPATFWWAIITMTTVGYGDITPKTVLGKVIGSVCCICGVLVVGLPIPIIVNNFAVYYRDQLRREKVLKRGILRELDIQNTCYQQQSPCSRAAQIGDNRLTIPRQLDTALSSNNLETELSELLSEPTSVANIDSKKPD